MEDKKIIGLKRQIHELNTQHNKLTFLCKMLYSNIQKLNSEMSSIKSNLGVNTTSNMQQQQQQQQQHQQQQLNQQSNQTFNGSLNDLQADEILRQLQNSQ